MAIALVAAAAGLIGFSAGENRGESLQKPGAENRDSSKFLEGPWGRIRFWNSMLEMPREMIALENPPAPATQWFFGFKTLPEVVQTLRDCGLGEDFAGKLAATAQAWPDGGFVLDPADFLITQIPPSARARIYAVLGKWPQNPTIAASGRFEKIGLHDWLDESELSPATDDLVRRLIYRKGGVEFFTDYDLVMRKLSDKREKTEFLRTMSRQNCVMGCLVVRPGDDLDRLAEYWGRGGRERDVRTLLECARLSDARHEISLRALMPDFVRDRMYRYRHEADPPAVNCHYSTMNFFTAYPDNCFTSLATCAQTIDRDYHMVTDGSRQFGDIVLLMSGEREVVHTCNIVAGNLVFTKNGNSQGQPWIIADLGELLDYFSADQPVTTHIARRNSPVAGM